MSCDDDTSGMRNRDLIRLPPHHDAKKHNGWTMGDLPNVLNFTIKEQKQMEESVCEDKHDNFEDYIQSDLEMSKSIKNNIAANSCQVEATINLSDTKRNNGFHKDDDYDGSNMKHVLEHESEIPNGIMYVSDKLKIGCSILSLLAYRKMITDTVGEVREDIMGCQMSELVMM